MRRRGFHRGGLFLNSPKVASSVFASSPIVFGEGNQLKEKLLLCSRSSFSFQTLSCHARCCSSSFSRAVAEGAALTSNPPFAGNLPMDSETEPKSVENIYSKEEIKALVFAILPTVPVSSLPSPSFSLLSSVGGVQSSSAPSLDPHLERNVGPHSGVSIVGVPAHAILHRLPRGVRQQLWAAALASRGGAAPPLPQGSHSTKREDDILLEYLATHFPHEVGKTSAGLLARVAVKQQSEGEEKTQKGPETPTEGKEKSDGGNGGALSSPARSASWNTAPPPPPTIAAAASSSPGSSFAPTSLSPNARSLKSSIQIIDALVPFIPTFFVHVNTVAATIPTEIQKLYSETSFEFFLKRFKHYVDLRTAHGQTEVRLRPSFDHAQRGAADSRFSPGLGGTSLMGSAVRRPPRNSEANLIGLVVPRLPKKFTPIADVLQDVAPIITRHPAFDPRLGVTGLLEKYPEYVQLVSGRLRTRPYKVAPNALDELDLLTSPLPTIFKKMEEMVEAAAAAVDHSYAAEGAKEKAMVPTARLYALLSPAERHRVKTQCRSFPRFLRLHGKVLCVSADKLKVHKFIPEYEVCAENLLDERLRMHSLSPNDPVLQIPTEMDAASNADWAVREVYDALPLLQCAELREVLTLVPTSVRAALPVEEDAVVGLLQQFSDYFVLWRYPDDEAVMVVQRAKIVEPKFEREEIVRAVLPLIPQGGTTLEKLMTRLPLPLQRYFYQHGLRKTLGEMKDVFLIVQDRIVRVG